MIAERIEAVRARIARAALRSGRRPEDVRLVAATKGVPIERVRQAASVGLAIFGENYVQEAQRKIEGLRDLRPRMGWHLIGHLQTNKASLAVDLFDCVETLDGLKLARALDQHAARAGRVLPVLVQVNVAGEATKAGLAPSEVGPFLRHAAGLGHIEIVGLMTIPPRTEDPEGAREYFRALRKLRDALRENLVPPSGPGELSMGMSDTFEVAIEEGATLVRVGTAIFGTRPKS